MLAMKVRPGRREFLGVPKHQMHALGPPEGFMPTLND